MSLQNILEKEKKDKRSNSFFADVLKQYETKHIYGTDGEAAELSEQTLICESRKKSFWKKQCFSHKSDYFSARKFKHRKKAVDYFPPLAPDSKRLPPPELDIKYLPLSFIPNFVIEEIISDPDAFRMVPLHLRSHAVLVMVDVSGFTPLTEIYNRKEQTGAADLAAELNNFMSDLASTLMSFGGDILNFAGDAFLCQWEGKEERDLTSMSEKAFACAVYIQNVLATDIKSLLRVKIGMTLGETKTQVLGSPSEFLLFVLSGAALVEVRIAEELCNPGEVVVSEEVFQCLRAKEVKMYNTVFLKHGFVKITGFGADTEEIPSFSDSGRLKLFQSCSPQIIALSRAFTIPILRDVKTTDQLNYLSEVSKVTILFMLLPKIDVVDPINLGTALEIILAAVKDFGGVLNKVLLFDKGCTFLAIFGLPGLKHLNDASRSLLCAARVIEELRKHDVDVSTGISSGTCFCGIIGHYQRQEYTVIGWRVNMACRLMTTYPEYGIVLDADTYHLCKQELGEKCFTELKKRKLKGIESVPRIYAYKPLLIHREPDVKTLMPSKSFIAINIDEQQKIYDMLLFFKSENAFENIRKEERLPVIAIGGKKGTGRSFFFHYATSVAKILNYQVLACTAVPPFVDLSFATISLMLRKFFCILSQGGKTRESVVLEYLSDETDPYLFLLNHLLEVKFPAPEHYEFQLESLNPHIERLLKAIICKICKSGEENPLLIGIDESEFMDTYSWRLLRDLVETEEIILLVTVSKKSDVSCISDGLIRMKAQYFITLKSFNSDLVLPMMCWFLGVIAVHKKLIQFLRTHVLDNSQLLEEILLCPSFINIFNITTKSSISEETFENWFLCNSDLDLTNSEESQLSDALVCDIKPDIQLKSLLLSYNVEEAVKERVNILRIQDRVVLKRAAILGFSFYYHCLETANSDLSSSSVAQSVENLVHGNILTFQSDADILPDSCFVPKKCPIIINVNTEHGYMYTKPLSNDDIPHRKSFLPLQKLQFCTLAFRVFILNNMTKDQKNTMHIEIIKQLDSEGKFCNDCKQQQRIFIKRASHTPETTKTATRTNSTYRRCLHIPQYDLRRCTCLIYRGNVYSKISAVYASVNSSFNSILFLVKAAEVYLEEGNPIKAVLYIQYGIKVYIASLLRRTSFKAELEAHPYVIKAALYRVQAEVLVQLNNVYGAANSAMRAMDLLGLNIVDFSGKYSKVVLNSVLKTNYMQRLEAIHSLAVICKSYLAVGDHETAFSIANCLIYLFDTELDSFHDILGAETLYYECKCSHFLQTSKVELEDTILHLCHDRMMDPNTPIDIIEIRDIAKAYRAILQYNLSQRKFLRAETVCSEAFRILKCISEHEELPIILSLGIQTCLHSKRFSTLLNYLNNLRSISIEKPSKVFLSVFYSCISELSGDRGVRSCFNARLSEFIEFVQNIDQPNILWRPRGMSYYAAAKLALWCLMDKVSDNEPEWIAVFYRWFSLAKLLQCKNADSYWFIGGDLTMIRMKLIITFRILNLTYEEKQSEFDSIESELKKIRFTVKAKYPVFDVMWESLIIDLVSIMPEVRPPLTGIKRFIEKAIQLEQNELVNIL